jgi:hypothetical protein
MLNFSEFFTACEGIWTTERIYHYIAQQEIERSYTEFTVQPLPTLVKQSILGLSTAASGRNLAIAYDQLAGHEANCPGFDIAFDTVSEKGDRVAMSLKALFVPEAYLAAAALPADLPLPVTAQVNQAPGSDVIHGLYFRDEGYSEGGAIAGQFTYQPTRQTLEMTTYYRRSVAVDQIRLIDPATRLRTIVTYDRPADGSMPTVITLIGFGVEHGKPTA